MIGKLFEKIGNNVVETEHCSTLSFLRVIKETYKKDYMKIYSYLFYMTCTNAEINPCWNLPEDEKEEFILKEVGIVPIEDELVIEAFKQCEKLYATPSRRHYLAMKIAVDNVSDFLSTTKINAEEKTGNATAYRGMMKEFQIYRKMFKEVEKDFNDEIQVVGRGNKKIPKV